MDASFLLLRERSVPGFFSGKVVLLTGATGFLAKALVEKILRDLPGVEKVVLLVREKGGGDTSGPASWDRAGKEIFGSGLFARLRREKGNDFERFVREKVECLGGDLRASDLGLGKEAFARLVDEVDLVVNCAAAVSFGERLDTAVETNVHGVAHLFELARAAGAVFVQVSTAYVSGRREGEVEEAVEPSSFDFGEEMGKLGGIMAGLRSKHSSPETLRREMVRCAAEVANSRGWIDIYTYTKYLGEQWLLRNRGDVATVIVRPSIIESSLHEPEPGWIEGLRMADPILIAMGRGLTGFPLDLDAVLDLVPLDHVVNAILAASCHAGTRSSGLDVFAVASGMDRPLWQRDLVGSVRAYYERWAAVAGVELPKWSFPSPARFRRDLDGRIRVLSMGHAVLARWSKFGWARRSCRILRRKLSVANRSRLFLERYGAYVRLRCRFQTARSGSLLRELSPVDRERFDFDVTTIDWKHYLQEVHLPGLFRSVAGVPIPCPEPERTDGSECLDLEIEANTGW